MNLDALEVAVRNRTGVPATDPLAGDAALDEIINEALHLFSSSRLWPWLEESVPLATVAGTQTYAMPVGWIATKQVKIDAYAPMDGRNSRAALDEWFSDSTTRGLPIYWCIGEDALRLYPTPNAVYAITHLYYEAEPALAAGTDVPLAPDWTHAAIADKASSLLLARLREYERATYWEGQYDKWLKGVIDNDRRSTPLARVRVRSGGFL